LKIISPDSIVYKSSFFLKAYAKDAKAYLIFLNDKFYSLGRIVEDTFFSWMKLSEGISRIKIKIFYDDGSDEDMNYKITFMKPFNVRYGNRCEKIVALTFDCGGYKEPCCEIFQILDKYKIKCTMFLTGEFIKNYPDISIYIAYRHEPANHTYSHPHFTTYELNGRFETAPHVDEHFVKRELVMCDSLFYEVTGRHFAPFWRAPYGEINEEIAGWAEEAGFIHVGWSYDIIDWADKNTPDLFEKSILRFKNLYKADLKGKIILMHIAADRTARELPKIIEFLHKNGYEIVTISQIMGLPLLNNPWEISYEDTSFKTLY